MSGPTIFDSDSARATPPLPSRAPALTALQHEVAAPPNARGYAKPNVSTEMVRLSAGAVLIGTGDADGRASARGGPLGKVQLKAFWIDRCAVTNARFAGFVAATRYVTEAEQFGWSFVFAGLLSAELAATRSVPDAPWWHQVAGADWCHPEGPQSDLVGRG